MGSVAKTVIIPMADYLRLGDEARLNAPSSMGAGNWSWRLRLGYGTVCLRERILALTPKGRLSKSFKKNCK
jgi:4-alpha-glucanotransferase